MREVLIDRGQTFQRVMVKPLVHPIEDL